MAKATFSQKLVNPLCGLELHHRLSTALSEEIVPDIESVVSLPFPDFDIPAERFRDKYLLKEVVRKYPGFDLGIDTKTAAISSFLEDEQLNYLTNDRLHSYSDNPSVMSVIELASRKIARVLGTFSWDKFLEGVRCGPGATTRLGRKDASVVNKLLGSPHVSSTAYNLAQEVISVSPMWAFGEISPVECVAQSLIIRELDKLTTVPKNAKTDRTIGIGPDLNIMLQLAVGYCMRCKMSRWGINLNDQSINMDRARESSISGKNATVDVKSASNSVVQALVWLLIGRMPHHQLDPTWYKLLEALRTPGCEIDGTPHEYQLFSAMGNGFTFELESLIFWALSRACCEHLHIVEDVTVYGDDIILPVEAKSLLEDVFSWCGFRINEDKTYGDPLGGFRESCGGHYLNGVDVSPFYVDAALDNVAEVVLLANNITRWSHKGHYRDGRLLPVWLWVVKHLPPQIQRCRIPLGESDDGLIMDFDEATPSCSYHYQVKRHEPRANAHMGFRCNTFVYQNRPFTPNGFEGYFMWHYNKNWKRFQPPGESKLGFVPTLHRYPKMGGGWVTRVWYDKNRAFRVNAYKPYQRAASRKKSLRLKRRSVRKWTHLGPWVTDNWVLDPIDVELVISLSNSA